MDAAGLLEYFKPLTDWLTEENKKTNEYIGWKPTKKRMYHKYVYKIFFKVLLFVFYILWIYFISNVVTSTEIYTF